MTWTEYHFQGIIDHDDPTKYENQVRQTGRFTASVWAVHVDVLTPQVGRVLDAIEYAAELRGYTLTGEYVIEQRDSSRWVRLSVYYRAPRMIPAYTIGRSLARSAYGEWDGEPAGDYSVTPAGNWNDVLVDAQLPKREEEGYGPRSAAAEDQGQPRE